MTKSMVNKRSVRKNDNLKKIQKNGKKLYVKGKSKVLKNYIGKLIQITNQELIGEEKKVVTPLSEDKVTKELFLDRLNQSKLTGMSGSGFLVLEKVTAFLNSQTQNKRLIINAVECEPGLKHDEWLLHNRFQEICMGVKYVAHALNIEEMTIAVKEKIDCIDSKITVCQIPARFPMGEEHYMIQSVTGIKLEKEIIPAKEGILVMNVQTVYQVYKLMNEAYEAKRFVTLANAETGEGRIAYIGASDSVNSLLKMAFGNAALNTYAGDGILRTDTVNENDCFETNISFAAVGKENSLSNDNKCKKCGACSKKCPVGIPVREIVRAREKDMNADISMYHPERCIKCGSCVYFCTADKLPGVYVNHKQM